MQKINPYLDIELLNKKAEGRTMALHSIGMGYKSSHVTFNGISYIVVYQDETKYMPEEGNNETDKKEPEEKKEVKKEKE